MRQLSKTRLQMRAANGNNLDIIGAIALRLSDSGMSIVSFIIKHTHFSGINVMLRSVSDRIDGGSPGVCVWEIGQVLPGLCFFPSETHLLYRRGRGRIGWMFQCSCWSASSWYYIITCEEILAQFTIVKYYILNCNIIN